MLYEVSVSHKIASLGPNGGGTRRRSGLTFGSVPTVVRHPTQAILDDPELRCRKIKTAPKGARVVEPKVPAPEAKDTKKPATEKFPAKKGGA